MLDNLFKKRKSKVSKQTPNNISSSQRLKYKERVI